MICKNCGEQQPDNALFCGSCGGSMQVVCARCKTPHDGAKFCTNCGLPTDGVTYCDVCATVNTGEHTFCQSCGERADGKISCLSCGHLVGRGLTFCDSCGFPVKTAQVKKDKAIAPRQKALRGGWLKDNKIVKLSHAWVMAGIFMFMFIFSCFSFIYMGAKVRLSNDYYYDTVRYDLEYKSGTFDAFEAIFAIGDDPDELLEELESATLRALERRYGTDKIVIDYNILKLEAATAGENKDFVTIIYIILRAFMPLLIILACLGGFILSLINAIKATTSDRKVHSKRNVAWLSVAAAMILGLLTLFRMSTSLVAMVSAGNVTGIVTLNGWASALLAFALIGIAIEIVHKYLLTDAKVDILRTVSAAVSIILLFIILNGIGQAVSTYKREGGSLQLFVITLIGKTLPIDDGTKASLITSILILIFALGLVAVTISALTKALSSGFSPKTKLNAVLSTVMFGISLVYVILLAVHTSEIERISNDGLSYLNSYYHVKISIAAWPIAICVLSAINATQCYVLGSVAKKLEKKSAPQQNVDQPNTELINRYNRYNID